MTIKIFYSITIIGCCSLLGFIFANTYIERTKLLGSLLSTMQMLETEIGYGATPLPLLLNPVGRKSRKEICEVFLKTADILDEKKGDTFGDAWAQAVRDKTKNSSFSKEDIELLLSIGTNLGISDCEDQLKHIKLLQVEIRRHYEEALEAQRKNVKLFRNLGLLLGLTIVILLY